MSEGASQPSEKVQTPEEIPSWRIKKPGMKDHVLAFVVEWWHCWVKPAGPSRWVAFFFIFGLLGTALSLGLAPFILHRAHVGADQDAGTEGHALNSSPLEEDELENAKKKGTLPIHLGSFTVELRDDEENPSAQGTIHMIEFDAFVECDVMETCDELKKNSERVRDQILKNVLTLTREEALTKDGKRRLREILMKSLNDWLKKGKVRAVYFSKFIVG